jgi:hypothetical protein
MGKTFKKRLRKTKRISKTRKNLKGKRQRSSKHGGGALFKKAKCAPKTSDKMQKFSCYTDDALLKMRNLWNARHSERPIATTVPQEIWQNLKEKMEDACKSEACWLKQKFMENNLNDELTTYTFAPKSPQKWKENHTTWLNSLDIEKVMKQYEHTYKCFRFIGPTPIDFDKKLYDAKCVWDDLCHFNLEKMLKEGVNKIGIIFNTDTHDKTGAHWISLFINIKKKFIFFFDSNGIAAPKEVKEFSNRVIAQGLELKTPKYPKGVRLAFHENAPLAHQEGNTECGMYSLYLIVTLLKEIHTFSYFQHNKITDAAMENLRDTYYNSDI